MHICPRLVRLVIYDLEANGAITPSRGTGSDTAQKPFVRLARLAHLKLAQAFRVQGGAPAGTPGGDQKLGSGIRPELMNRSSRRLTDILPHPGFSQASR